MTTSTPSTPTPKKRAPKELSPKLSTKRKLDCQCISPKIGTLTTLKPRYKLSTPTTTPSRQPPSKDLSDDKLSQLASLADKARKSSVVALNMAGASITIMLEANREVKTAIQSLADMRIVIDTMTRKASTRKHTTAALKRELADLVYKYVNFFDTYEASSASGWKAWHSAMSNIIQAGKAQRDHYQVLKRMSELARGEHQKSEIDRIRGVRHALLHTDADMILEVQKAAADSLESLRQGLRTLRSGAEARDWVTGEIKKATEKARDAIAAAASG